MSTEAHDEDVDEERPVPNDDPSSRGGQTLAIGLYIGSLVLIIGLLLTIYGAVDGPQLAQDGSTANKDLIWGLVLCAVALVTLALAWFSPRRRGRTAS